MFKFMYTLSVLYGLKDHVLELKMIIMLHFSLRFAVFCTKSYFFVHLNI
jgi:hypothetical protein